MDKELEADLGKVNIGGAASHAIQLVEEVLTDNDKTTIQHAMDLIHQDKLTPDLATQLWFALHATSRLRSRLLQWERVGKSASRRIAPKMGFETENM